MQFYIYANRTIHDVDSYKYLGVLYSSQGNPHKEHLQYAESGGNKAIYLYTYDSKI